MMRTQIVQIVRPFLASPVKISSDGRAAPPMQLVALVPLLRSIRAFDGWTVHSIWHASAPSQHTKKSERVVAQEKQSDHSTTKKG
jgi:hypothetical protein